jgi:hypothetical protein
MSWVKRSKLIFTDRTGVQLTLLPHVKTKKILTAFSSTDRFFVDKRFNLLIERVLLNTKYKQATID